MLTAISSDKIDISSEKKIEDFAYKFQKKIKPGLIIFLYGEIGVGKTTFVRHLINSHQKKNKLELTEVTSPTFNLCNHYQIKNIKINHYDLFRLKSEDDLKSLDLFDDNSDTVTLVEWPQIINNKPKNLIELYFEYENDHKKRSVKIKGLKL
jgi:tRNA threonylcarbamoyladenosine biosynthesis protein TsaE